MVVLVDGRDGVVTETLTSEMISSDGRIGSQWY